MNILMVNPRGFYYDEGVTTYKRTSFPMGLMQLSSSLKRIQANPNSGDWQVLNEDRKDRSVSLLDAGAEGYGRADGVGDPLVERNNRRIRIFGLNNDEIVARVKASQPDVIFITEQFTKQLDEFYAISRLLRENFPQATIVAGGIALTDLGGLPVDTEEKTGEEMTKERQRRQREPYENGVDIVVRGEGELPAVLLVDTLEQLEDRTNLGQSALQAVPNLEYLDGDTLKRTETRRLSEEELDRLPFPDLEIIDKGLYGADRAHFGEAKGAWIEMFTSRGCSKECTFCATKPYWGGFRRLSDLRIQELLNYYKENGFEEVCIEDDSILDDPERATRIFRMVKDTGFDQFTCIGGIEFKHLLFKSNGEKFYTDKLSGTVISQEEFDSRTPFLSEKEIEQRFSKMVDGEDIIKAMGPDYDETTGESRDNGCYRIYLAMESANPDTLESIGKSRKYPEGHSRSEAEAMQLLDQSGIEAHGGMMMGNPETEGIDEMMNNIRFCREMMESGLGRVAFFPYIMLPGSTMSTINNPMLNYARIRDEFGYLSYGFDTTNMDSRAHEWTAEELVTINTWSNNLFKAGGGKNWSRGSSVSAEELDRQIDMISDREILYQTTALRVLKEAGIKLLSLYHEALVAVSPDHNLPEYAYKLEGVHELTNEQREQMVTETQSALADYIASTNETLASEPIQDRRIDYARDYLEFAMRAPEIEIVPNESTLMVQESSDSSDLVGEDQETTREIKREVVAEKSAESDLEPSVAPRVESRPRF